MEGWAWVCCCCRRRRRRRYFTREGNNQKSLCQKLLLKLEQSLPSVAVGLRWNHFSPLRTDIDTRWLRYYRVRRSNLPSHGFTLGVILRYGVLRSLEMLLVVVVNIVCARCLSLFFFFLAVRILPRRFLCRPLVTNCSVFKSQKRKKKIDIRGFLFF